MSNIEFKWNTAATYLVNALRRTIVSDIDAVAVPNAKYTTAGLHGTLIIENTSQLHNEYIMQRAAMLPLTLNPNDMAHTVFELEVDVLGRVVNSGDISIKKQSSRYASFKASELSNTPLTRACLSIGKMTDALAKYGVTLPKDICTDVLISKLQPGETLKMRMFPCIGTATDDAGFSLVSKCCFVKTETDFVFRIGLIDIERNLASFVEMAFNKLLLRIDRLECYFAGYLEVDVGKHHAWLQDVVDVDAPVIVFVDGKPVCGATLRAVHASSFCIKMPDGCCNAAPQKITVEMLGDTGTLVFDSVTVVRSLSLEQHISNKPFKITIMNESHTLGNLLQGFIFDTCVQNSDSPCRCASYMKPYPLDDYIIVQLELEDSSIRSSLKFLVESTKQLRTYIQTEKEAVLRQIHDV
jgi:DNA-directed RNA polymerase subunit L